MVRMSRVRLGFCDEEVYTVPDFDEQVSSSVGYSRQYSANYDKVFKN